MANPSARPSAPTTLPYASSAHTSQLMSNTFDQRANVNTTSTIEQNLANVMSKFQQQQQQQQQTGGWNPQRMSIICVYFRVRSALVQAVFIGNMITFTWQCQHERCRIGLTVVINVCTWFMWRSPLSHDKSTEYIRCPSSAISHYTRAHWSQTNRQPVATAIRAAQ